MTGLVSLLGVKITFPQIFLVNGVSIRSTKQSELFLFFKENHKQPRLKHSSTFQFISPPSSI